MNPDQIRATFPEDKGCARAKCNAPLDAIVNHNNFKRNQMYKNGIITASNIHTFNPHEILKFYNFFLQIFELLYILYTVFSLNQAMACI